MVAVLNYIKRGLQDTPDDISEWMKKTYNEFHGGVGYTLPESFDDALLAETFWQGHCADNNIRSSTCPSKGEHRYDKVKERTVMGTYSNRWGNWDEFGLTLALRKSLDLVEIQDSTPWLMVKDTLPNPEA